MKPRKLTLLRLLDNCVLNTSLHFQSSALCGHRETYRQTQRFWWRAAALSGPSRTRITWVNKALGWDVVFNRGVAPQQKTLIARVCQHDGGDGRKSAGPSGICCGSAVDGIRVFDLKSSTVVLQRMIKMTTNILTHGAHKCQAQKISTSSSEIRRIYCRESQ